MDEVRDQLIEKVIIANNSRPQRTYYSKKEDFSSLVIRKNNLNDFSLSAEKKMDLPFPLILLGTSTGGPRALHRVMEDLSNEIDAPVLIVQHMPATFTKSLAARLNSVSDFTVKEAEDGEIVKKRHAYLAPGGYQMGIRLLNDQIYIRLSKDDPVNGHRPSVDYLFNSFAGYDSQKIIAVIMTGMGYDGRNGMKRLNSQGAFTIAESEESCVVYGMPKAAVEADAVNVVTCLNNISYEIQKAYRSLKG